MLAGRGGLLQTQHRARLFIRAARSPHAQPAEDHLEWAEVGERGLQQIESHETGKPQPILAVIVGQHEADEDEAPGKPANDHFHSVASLVCFNVRLRLHFS